MQISIAEYLEDLLEELRTALKMLKSNKARHRADRRSPHPPTIKVGDLVQHKKAVLFNGQVSRVSKRWPSWLSWENWLSGSWPWQYYYWVEVQPIDKSTLMSGLLEDWEVIKELPQEEKALHEQ